MQDLQTQSQDQRRLSPQKQTYATVSQMLEKSRDSIAAALPRHLTVERLTRVALGELRTNPKLLECQPASLMSAIVKASQLGLEVGSAMGHAYLVPYKTEATLIIGYRGMLALARRSGEIQSITARVVYSRDTFDLEYGLEEKLRHIPSTDEDPGQVTHVYAVAKLVDGGIQYEVMTRAEVEAIRRRSRAGGSGPWVSDWNEMARKTVLRRLFKYLPMSIEMADSLAVDDDDHAEKVVTADRVLDLNARLAAETTTKAIPAQPAQEWPQANPETGEMVDSRGVPWIDGIHSSGKTCNADGTWRRQKGISQEAAAAREASARLTPEPETPPTESGSNLTFDSVMRGIEMADTKDQIDEWLDLSRGLDLYPEGRATIDQAAEKRLAEISS